MPNDFVKKACEPSVKPLDVSALERYETSLRHPWEFLNYKYGVSDIDFKKTDNSLISEYDFYLRSARNNR